MSTGEGGEGGRVFKLLYQRNFHLEDCIVNVLRQMFRILVSQTAN